MFNAAALAAAPARDGASLVDRLMAMVAIAIDASRVASGSRMPSVRRLADDCEVSRDTVAKAYNKLVAQGFLEARRGSGFFVRSRGGRRVSGVYAPHLPAFTSRALDQVYRFRMSLVEAPPFLKSRTGSGNLPDHWVNTDAIASALRKAIRAPALISNRPGDMQGFAPLREQLSVKLEQLGIRVEPSSILTTNGATGAISLIAQHLLSPGEKVLVEQPTQPILVQRLAATGVDFAYVPRRHDGPDLACLRALCEQHRPRLFFCNTVLHNPTSTTVAPHIAYRLLGLAEEFDLTIVEDDSYSDLQPSSLPSMRLASLDQLNRVIYVGSFSKTLSAQLRVGFLACNPELVEWLRVHRMLNGLALNDIAERAVFHLLSEGNYRHHCADLRDRLASAHPRVIDQLHHQGFSVNPESDAGLYVWANLGRDVDALQVANLMLEDGHLTAPGSLFSHAFASYMRFNVAETVDGRIPQAVSDRLFAKN